MTTTLITYIVLGIEISTLLYQHLKATPVAIRCRGHQCSASILKHGDIVGEKRERGEEGGRRRVRGGRGGVWVVMMNGSWINGYDSTDGCFSEG